MSTYGDAVMKFTIWYAKPESFLDFMIGRKVPVLATLADTHTVVRSIEATDLEDAFYQMQGEIWSPNGEARELLESLGLKHTSMSVGDVAVADDGMAHAVAMIGFTKIGRFT